MNKFITLMIIALVGVHAFEFDISALIQVNMMSMIRPELNLMMPCKVSMIYSMTLKLATLKLKVLLMRRTFLMKKLECKELQLLPEFTKWTLRHGKQPRLEEIKLELNTLMLQIISIGLPKELLILKEDQLN